MTARAITDPTRGMKRRTRSIRRGKGPLFLFSVCVCVCMCVCACERKMTEASLGIKRRRKGRSPHRRSGRSGRRRRGGGGYKRKKDTRTDGRGRVGIKKRWW